MSTVSVVSPVTGQPLYTLASADAAQVQAAYTQARAAQAAIRAMPVKQRAQALHLLQYWIADNKEYLIDRIVAETGKSRFDCLGSEIFPTLDTIHYHAGMAPKVLKNKTLPFSFLFMGKSSQIWYEPAGTVLVISPWNYPFFQALVPIAIAFAAGNAVIYKPSEVTPLKGLVEEVLEKSGFAAAVPKGAVQIVYGAKETGQLLVEARPDKIFFTGSVNTGKRIMETAAKQLIPVELELGGKDPMIVFDDVNLERTVNGALWGALTNCGQSCTSVERLYVQQGIYPQFLALLKEKIARLKVASTATDVVKELALDVGTMTAGFQAQVVHAHASAAIAAGATLEFPASLPAEGSLHLPPLLLSGLTAKMQVVAEETFGPVLPVIPFKTEEEAIQLANDSAYGLSASVWSKDIARAKRVAAAIHTGNVSINNVMYTEANPALPFGGVKNSGIGRYKGEYGLLAFCNVKSVLVDQQGPKLEPHWYPYTPEKYAAMSTLADKLFSRKASFIGFLMAGLKLEGLAKKQKL